MSKDEPDIFEAAIDAEEANNPTVLAPDAPRELPAAPQPPQPPQGNEVQAAEGAAPQTEKPDPSENTRVPLRELLDTRERAQRAEQEREEYRRRLETYERQQQQQARQQQPSQVPDVFSDPEGYTNHLKQTFEERIANIQLETNLQLAEVRHGETFGKAYEAFVGQVSNGRDAALYHQVMRSQNPGEAMVSWFKEREVIKTIGTDPNAYRQRLQDELLNDEAFVAKVIERVRGGNGGAQNSSRPTNITRLPPSLNRQTSAAPARDADDGDGSEEAIWEAARDSKGRFKSG